MRTQTNRPQASLSLNNNDAVLRKTALTNLSVTPSRRQAQMQLRPAMSIHCTFIVGFPPRKNTINDRR
jgi:hypothetical protein